MPKRKRSPDTTKQVVYFPTRLHKLLRMTAARENQSRSKLVVEAVQKFFEGDKPNGEQHGA